MAVTQIVTASVVETENGEDMRILQELDFANGYKSEATFPLNRSDLVKLVLSPVWRIQFSSKLFESVFG